MIYFVRHGQTDYNLNKIYAGQQDIPLNQNGIEQAKQTALDLQKIKFDVCFCSPLIRAKQTCYEILKHHNNLSPIFDDRLKERYYGKLENQPVGSIKFNRWKVGADEEQTKNLNIEMIIDVYKRVSNFFDEILNKYKDKNILVVAHSGIGRIGSAYFNGFPPENDFSTINIPNAGIVIFDKKQNEKNELYLI